MKAGEESAQANPTIVADCIREVGRGKDGARSLDTGRAHALFAEVFAGRVDPMALGGLMIALRVKGETVEELDGAMRALDPYVARVPVDPDRPVVVLPSYNGARNMANLTPLLACLLADAGVQVIVHGVRLDPRRTTTLQVMQAMGLPPVSRIDEAGDVLARHDPVFVPIDLLSPALTRMLAIRQVLGVRNIGHTLAKLLRPADAARCLLLASFTHPEFDRLQHDYFMRTRIAALVMRGTEGEVVASAKRAARIDWLHDGQCDTLVDSQTLPLGEVPALPQAQDASGTARWIQSVLAGERSVPAPIEAQVACVLRALGLEVAASVAAAAPARASSLITGDLVDRHPPTGEDVDALPVAAGLSISNEARIAIAGTGSGAAGFNAMAADPGRLAGASAGRASDLRPDWRGTDGLSTPRSAERSAPARGAGPSLPSSSGGTVRPMRTRKEW